MPVVLFIGCFILISSVPMLWMTGRFTRSGKPPDSALRLAHAISIAYVPTTGYSDPKVLRRVDLAGHRMIDDVPLPIPASDVCAVAADGNRRIAVLWSEGIGRRVDGLALVSGKDVENRRFAIPKVEGRGPIAWAGARRIALLAADNSVWIYDTASRALDRPPGSVWPADLSPSGRYELTGRRVEYWVYYKGVRDRKTGRVVPLPGKCRTPCWSPTGDELAIMSRDHVVVVKCATGHVRRVFGDKRIIFGARYDNTGRYLIIELQPGPKAGWNELWGCELGTARTWRIVADVERRAWTTVPAARTADMQETAPPQSNR